MHVNTSKHHHLRLYNIVLNEIKIQACKGFLCVQVSCITSTSKVEKSYENKHYQNSKVFKSIKEFWAWIHFVFHFFSLCIYIFFFIEVFFAFAYDFYPPYLSKNKIIFFFHPISPISIETSMNGGFHTIEIGSPLYE